VTLTAGGQAPWMVPGERLLWVGHPDPTPGHIGRRAGRSLAVLLAGGVVLYLWSRAGIGPPLWFYGFGVVIIGLNLFGAAAGPSLRRAQLRRTTYVVTDRRAAVLRTADAAPEDTGVATPLLTVSRDDDGIHGNVDWGPSSEAVAHPSPWSPVSGRFPRRRGLAVQMGLRDPDVGRVLFRNVADFTALLEAMTVARRAWGVDTPTGQPGARYAPPLPWQQQQGPPPPT
jgi:hypothetical protein